MPPSSHGRSGFTTIRTAAHLAHNRRGIPSDGVSTQPRCPWGGGSRFRVPAISFITDLPGQPGDTIPVRYHGGGLASLGLPPLDPPIVIKKHRSSLSGNAVQPYVGVGGITAPFLHVPRYGGYRATLIGWARLEWGGTYAPTNGRTCGCSHLRSDRRVRQQKRQCRVDDDHPIDDSASTC